MKEGEVWSADFPFEEDPRKSKVRPVVIMRIAPTGVVVLKVTTAGIRDKYDRTIEHYLEANLPLPSFVRVSKCIKMNPSAFIEKIGILHPDDHMLIMNTFRRMLSGI